MDGPSEPVTNSAASADLTRDDAGNFFAQRIAFPLGLLVLLRKLDHLLLQLDETPIGFQTVRIRFGRR